MSATHGRRTMFAAAVAVMTLAPSAWAQLPGPDRKCGTTGATAAPADPEDRGRTRIVAGGPAFVQPTHLLPAVVEVPGLPDALGDLPGYGVAHLVLVTAGCDLPGLAVPGEAPLRYRDPVFTDVTVTSGVDYWTANNLAGEPVALKLDVYAPAGDTVTNRPAIIWVHGSGVNFYYPTYVKIGRELAARGFAFIAVNTRMHDLGTVAAGFHGEKRIRGGVYWGRYSDQARDIAAWIAFANERGFKQVVLAGHSAGTTAVEAYQAEKQDPRVAGLVLASGRFQPDTTPTDQEMLAQAARLVTEGRGEELLHYPNRPTPSFVSSTDIRRTTACVAGVVSEADIAALMAVVAQVQQARADQREALIYLAQHCDTAQ